MKLIMLSAVLFLSTNVLADDMTVERDCLARTVYFESRDQGPAGMIAVAQVVMNRVESPHFPDTICHVVKQGKYWKHIPIKWRCQFTWYCDGLSDHPTDPVAWIESIRYANMVYEYYHVIPDVTNGSLFYHAVWVAPKWPYKQTVQIADHVFYKLDDSF